MKPRVDRAHRAATHISTTRRQACLKSAVELKEERADRSLLNAQ